MSTVPVSGPAPEGVPVEPVVRPSRAGRNLPAAIAVGVGLGALILVSLLVVRGAFLGVATAVTATLGDLSESLIKRDLGIKDMGTLLPGHGGLMDRLDALVVVAPVAWALLLWFVPLG